MTQLSGRCINYDSCGLAARHDSVKADELAFVCPECGMQLKPVASASMPRPKGLALGLGLAVLTVATGVGLYTLYRSSQPSAAPSAVALADVASDTSADWRTKPSDDAPAPIELGGVGCDPAPLLMPGKRTLFQRVLIRPGATLVNRPGESEGTPISPMLTYYVYAREAVSGEEWIQIGPHADCHVDGWLPEANTVPWKQQIVLTFDVPAGRDRVLFFRNPEDIRRIAELPDPATELDPILASIRGPSPDRRIIAAEPENYVDFTRDFYLLPIVDFESATIKDEEFHLLRIHSISEPGGDATEAGPPMSAVVFVIDSTISMGPYIKRTREAVQGIYEALSQALGGDQIRFGLVAYRSSTDAEPRLEYVAKLFVDPNSPENARAFEAGIGQVDAAPVPSPGFDEDAYAGVMLALDAIDWTPYLSRQIILITDAGAVGPTNKLSRTRRSAEEVADAARDKDVMLLALHLLTRAGANAGNHGKAAAQYRQLTDTTFTAEPLYYAIENADKVERFGGSIDCLIRAISYTIQNLQKNRRGFSEALSEFCPQGDPTIEKMLEDAEVMDWVMRLKYLGRSPDAQSAPQDFGGWIYDHDLRYPVRPTVEVRVLLTKNQLNNLSNGVRVILDAARSGKSSAVQFYRSLADFSSQMGRDAALAKPARAATIADMGILGEYLDDLPYKSDILRINQDIWESMGASEQDQVIREIENKLERYRVYESDCTRWVALSSDSPATAGGCGGTDDRLGDLVYPIPLDALP